MGQMKERSAGVRDVQLLLSHWLKESFSSLSGELIASSELLQLPLDITIFGDHEKVGELARPHFIAERTSNSLALIENM